MDTIGQQHSSYYDFTNTYSYSIGGDIFPIGYNIIGGDILGIGFDKSYPPALNVSLYPYTSTDSKLTIEIPRDLLDSRDNTSKDNDL